MFQNIDAERARKGWSKVRLSKELDVSYSTFKNWMLGKSDIPCSKLIKMAHIFNVSTDYLLGIDEKNSA